MIGDHDSAPTGSGTSHGFGVPGVATAWANRPSDARDVVTHHVEGSLAPDFTDTDQPRPFKLEGDRMEIGDGKICRRVLERVR